MNYKTNKQLADAISNALFHGEYFTKDNSKEGYFERLGYVVRDSDSIIDREPIMLAVADNGVELTWMHDDALNLGDGGMENFLKGMMHVIDSSLKPQEVDGKTLVFEYTDPENPQK